MNIEDLRNKHCENISKADKYSYLLGIEEIHFAKEHTNLSVEFAIEVLEELNNKMTSNIDHYGWWYMNKVGEKIEELKQHLK